MPRLRPPIVCYGGKWYSAKHIVPLLPPCETYCEPFAGGLNILWCKPPSPTEIIGDLNPHLINFYNMLKLQHDKFIKTVRQFPYAESTYNLGVKWLRSESALERGIGYFITGRLSYSGWRKSFRPDTTARSSVSNAKIYSGCLSQLQLICERIRN